LDPVGPTRFGDEVRAGVVLAGVFDDRRVAAPETAYGSARGKKL
jgi:hypothetical protein